VYRSQRYRREQERKLDQLNVVHLRDEFTRKGEGYRLAIPARDEADRTKTRQVLEGAGYTFWETGDGIEVHFYFEEEAQAALDAVAKHGLKGGYGRNEGLIPVWTVYAGPFSEGEARDLQQRLAGDGVETLLKKRP
jgi:hypothetical protein